MSCKLEIVIAYINFMNELLTINEEEFDPELNDIIEEYAHKIQELGAEIKLIDNQYYLINFTIVS
jgi:esterase/lipase